MPPRASGRDRGVASGTALGGFGRFPNRYGDPARALGAVKALGVAGALAPPSVAEKASCPLDWRQRVSAWTGMGGDDPREALSPPDPARDPAGARRHRISHGGVRGSALAGPGSGPEGKGPQGTVGGVFASGGADRVAAAATRAANAMGRERAEVSAARAEALCGELLKEGHHWSGGQSTRLQNSSNKSSNNIVLRTTRY